MRLAGWLQSETAKLTGVSYNERKGSSTVCKWRAPLTSNDYREVHYAPWRLLLIYAGVVSVEVGLDTIAKRPSQRTAEQPSGT